MPEHHCHRPRAQKSGSQQSLPTKLPALVNIGANNITNQTACNETVIKQSYPQPLQCLPLGRPESVVQLSHDVSTRWAVQKNPPPPPDQAHCKTSTPGTCYADYTRRLRPDFLPVREARGKKGVGAQLQHKLIAPIACTGPAEICFGGGERAALQSGTCMHLGWSARPVAPRGGLPRRQGGCCAGGTALGVIHEFIIELGVISCARCARG
jgi:hypothetical protein